jgi:hypothetical protein
MSSDMATLVRRLRKLKCKVDGGGSKHYQVRLPNGRTVFMPSTPSDHRSIPNVRAQLRRAGLDL